MNGFNRDDVINYINGDDIVGKNIEDLENNPDFMIAVIIMSNDYNFYNLCSLEVKKNIRFVKFFVKKFYKYPDIVCNAVDFYLKNFASLMNENKKQDIIELLIIIFDLTNGTEKKYNNYVFLLESIYCKNRLNYYKSELSDEIYDYGFWEIYDEFYQHPLIVDYFAKKVLNEILENRSHKLIINMHKIFNSYEELEKYGIRKYMLEFISNYDDTLSSYLSTNIKLLNDYVEKIKNLKSTWSYVEEKAQSDRYDLIYEFVFKYIETFCYDCIDTSILYLIGVELGINKNILKNYLDLADEDIKYLNENTRQNRTIDINEFKHYSDIKKIAKTILTIEDLNDIGDFDDFMEYLGISLQR